MAKIFNVNGDCKPNLHYMVNISERLRQIKNMVDEGQYFTINRARQYGKTTTLRALEEFLQKEYTVVSLDFQRMSYADFENENSFVMAFSGEILDCMRFPEEIPDTTKIIIAQRVSSVLRMGMRDRLRFQDYFVV